MKQRSRLQEFHYLPNLRFQGDSLKRRFLAIRFRSKPVRFLCEVGLQRIPSMRHRFLSLLNQNLHFLPCHAHSSDQREMTHPHPLGVLRNQAETPTEQESLQEQQCLVVIFPAFLSQHLFLRRLFLRVMLGLVRVYFLPYFGGIQPLNEDPINITIQE